MACHRATHRVQSKAATDTYDDASSTHLARFLCGKISTSIIPTSGDFCFSYRLKISRRKQTDEQPSTRWCHRPMISSASCKYAMFHLPKTSSGTAPPLGTLAELSQEKKQFVARQSISVVVVTVNAPQRQGQGQAASVSVSVTPRSRQEPSQYTETGRCNVPIRQAPGVRLNLLAVVLLTGTPLFKVPSAFCRRTLYLCFH